MRYFFSLNVKRKIKGSIKNLFVGGWSVVNNDTYLGNNVSFNGMKIYGVGKVVIGNYFHSGVDCMIISSNHNYKGDKIPYDSEHIKKEIIIEDFVWMGSKVSVLGNVTIGEGAIIQAGAVVVSNVPKYAIVGGNPAKVFMYRDKEKFELLKSQGKFH